MEEKRKWVTGWGAGTSYITAAVGDRLKDRTVRYMLVPTMNADKVRLRFSNRYGVEAVELTAVSIAVSVNDRCVVASTVTPITFGGKRTAELEAGQAELVSDEISFKVTAGERYSVSMYFAKDTQMMTGHSNSHNFIWNAFCDGNYADAAELPLELYADGGPYMLLHSVDFLCSEECSSIVAFGDSITARPWLDVVNRTLGENGNTRRVLIRRAIGGNRVLSEYTAVNKRKFGEAGINRFRRDLRETVGARAVVVLHGINDIFHPRRDNPFCGIETLPTTEDIIEGYRRYIAIAHARGVKIYFATLLPCPPLAAHDQRKPAIREALNEWIRTNCEADGFIDFESAVWDPANSDNMLAEYDSGDHLHPSYAGSKKMAAIAYETLSSYGEL